MSFTLPASLTPATPSPPLLGRPATEIMTLDSPGCTGVASSAGLLFSTAVVLLEGGAASSSDPDRSSSPMHSPSSSSADECPPGLDTKVAVETAAVHPRLHVSHLPVVFCCTLPGPVLGTTVLPSGTIAALPGRPLSLLLRPPAVEPEGPGISPRAPLRTSDSLTLGAGLTLLSTLAVLGRCAAPATSR